MNGVGFGNVGPHIRTKMTPWLPIEIISDALSHFDAISILNKNKNFTSFEEKLCRIGCI